MATKSIGTTRESVGTVKPAPSLNLATPATVTVIKNNGAMVNPAGKLAAELTEITNRILLETGRNPNAHILNIATHGALLRRMDNNQRLYRVCECVFHNSAQPYTKQWEEILIKTLWQTNSSQPTLLSYT